MAIPKIQIKGFPSIGVLHADVVGIKKLFSNFNPSNASGPDNIPCYVLKELVAELAQIFTLFFKQSLNTSEIPLDWCKADITPIYKQGSVYEAANYRPISCVACKLLEHIIYSHV